MKLSDRVRAITDQDGRRIIPEIWMPRVMDHLRREGVTAQAAPMGLWLALLPWLQVWVPILGMQGRPGLLQRAEWWWEHVGQFKHSITIIEQSTTHPARVMAVFNVRRGAVDHLQRVDPPRQDGLSELIREAQYNPQRHANYERERRRGMKDWAKSKPVRG